MKIRNIIIGAGLSLALALSGAGIANATEPSFASEIIVPTSVTKLHREMAHTSYSASHDSEIAGITEDQLIEAFSAIEAIPDEVLAKNDPQALKAWYDSLGQDRINWIACGSAIGLAIITNFTPAKIVKIKSAIKTVGGAVTFAKKVYSAYKAARAEKIAPKYALNAAIREGAKAAAPDVKEALLELFGLGAVLSTCGMGD